MRKGKGGVEGEEGEEEEEGEGREGVEGEEGEEEEGARASGFCRLLARSSIIFLYCSLSEEGDLIRRMHVFRIEIKLWLEMNRGSSLLRNAAQPCSTAEIGKFRSAARAADRRACSANGAREELSPQARTRLPHTIAG